MNQPTICLNMIVKNESEIIEDTLNNILEYIPIDYWVIVDTGSSDDTCQKIQNFFDTRGIPGELYQDEWINFACNRNLAYQRCHGKSDYVFFFDADDRFYGDFTLPKELTADVYLMTVQHGESDTYLTRPLLVSNRSDFRWRGIIHEFFDFNQEDVTVVALNDANYVVNSGKFGARHKTGESLLSDLALLEAAYHQPDEEELRSHYAFSCGKICVLIGDKDKAVFWLETSLQLEPFSTEPMEAYRILGALYEEKGDKDKALQLYLKGFDAYPDYLENPYQLILLWQERQEFRRAYDLALSLRDLPFPSGKPHQGQKSLYDIFFPYELFQLAFRFEDWATVVEAGYKVLKANQAPLPLKAKVIEQLSVIGEYLSRLSQRELSLLNKEVVAYLEVTSFSPAEQLVEQINQLLKTKAKKRLLVLHPFMMVGGVETVLKDYLQLLIDDAQYDVELVCADYAEPKMYEGLPKPLRVHQLLNKFESQFYIRAHMQASTAQISEEDRNYYKSWYFGINKEINRRLMTLVRERHYDVIIDFKDSLFSHFYDSLTKFQLPIVYWVHSNDYFDNWRNYPEAYRAIFRQAVAVVSISEEMSQQVNVAFEELGLANNKPILETIYNPVNQDNIHHLAQQALIPEEERLLQEPFILAVSRLYDPQKNLSELIELYALLRERGVTEKLYIIGDGPSRPLLESKIRALGLENDCLLLGTKFTVYPFMAAAKVFVHTAHYEGLPTVLIESMACRTPVVAYDCPTGPREILNNGTLGRLIPLYHQEAFISAVIALLANPSEASVLADKAYQSLDRFRPDSILSQFDHLMARI